MIQIVRRFIAVLAACGIAVSILAYVESLSGATIDDMLPSVAVLVIGAIVLQIPIFVLERSSLRRFYWKGFARGMPSWVVPFVKLFWLIFLAHLFWFFVRSGAGVPIIKDGQYIISSRGRILKVLTKPEYLTLKAGELREFAALMIACYLMPMMYWWFPRNHQQAD